MIFYIVKISAICYYCGADCIQHSNKRNRGVIVDKSRCGIFGCSPLYFDWGFDEEDARCKKMKQDMSREIERLCNNGISCFAIVMDGGVGLYAAELINKLRKSRKELFLICYVPYEGQANKWPSELRERYFDVLENSSDVITLERGYRPGSETRARVTAVHFAHRLILVNSAANPEDSMTAIAALSELAKIPVILIDPLDKGQS